MLLYWLSAILYTNIYFQKYTLFVVWHRYEQNTPSPTQIYAQVQNYKNHSLVIFCRMKFYCQTNKQKQRLISSFVCESHFFKTQTTHKHVILKREVQYNKYEQEK